MEDMELPRSRQEAKDIGAAFYFTGLPCKRGHIARRELKGNCIECRKEDTRAAAEVRAEYFREYNRREHVKDRKHEWYITNSKAVKERAATRPASVCREYQRAWKSRNIDKVRADTKSRRRKHRDATPPWLTEVQKREIRELYRIAIHMTKITGEQYVVDHIFPLRSDISCGLHVPWNLRVVTQTENLEKSNRIPEGRGYAFDPDWGKLETSEGAA